MQTYQHFIDGASAGLGRESGLEPIKEYLPVKSVWIATESSVANPFIIR